MEGSKNAQHYNRTAISCFLGIIVQAVTSNLAAILFVPFMGLYGLTYVHLGVLVAVNFTAQVAADLIFSKFIDKAGFKKVVIPALIAATFGLALFALSPFIFKKAVFTGILISTVIFAAASGIMEITLSPIIASIPYKHKGPAMSLMHSFYAWGSVLTIVVTTLLIFVLGAANWYLIVLMWLIVPAATLILFSLSPFPPVVPEEKRMKNKRLIKRPFFIVALLCICFGACAEIVMNQFSSSFMENALQLDKVTGDLIGMCGFSIMLGLGRLLFGFFGKKINMHTVLITGAAVALVCYAGAALSPFTGLSAAFIVLCGLGTSLLWPGTIVVCSEKFPLAGGWMFAILAAFGDIGAAIAPLASGAVADYSGGTGIVSWFMNSFNITQEQASLRFSLLFAAIFVAACLVCHIILKKLKTKDTLPEDSFTENILEIPAA